MLDFLESIPPLTGVGCAGFGAAVGLLEWVAAEESWKPPSWILTSATILALAMGAIGVFLIVYGLTHRRSKKLDKPKELLPLLHRLYLKIDEARALAEQMHEVAPGPTLEPARAWRGEICEVLHVEKPDWARRFRDNTDEIPQITDQTFFPARLIFEHQIEQLEDILSNKQH